MTESVVPIGKERENYRRTLSSNLDLIILAAYIGNLLVGFFFFFISSTPASTINYVFAWALSILAIYKNMRALGYTLVIFTVIVTAVALFFGFFIALGEAGENGEAILHLLLPLAIR